MTISEKSAYLKGLMDGLNLDTEKAEGKMIAAIVELLGDVTKKLTDVEETTINICDELDEIEEDLDAIEDYILDEEDEDEDEDDCYATVCPSCEEEIFFDDSILEEGEVICPNCGEKLEFDLSDLANATGMDDED